MFRRRRDGSIAHIGDRLADQLLDRRDSLGVVRSRDDGDRRAGAAGAAGAADPVHVVIGVDRDVEIVDVAHLWNVESARGNIRSDQQRDLILAELFERGHARRLVHVAVQRLHRKAVAVERAMQRRDVALAVAENDGVLQTVGGAE